MKHVVFMSGGIGSWACAKRVADRFGTEDMILLFTDTKSEDKETYEFLEAASLNVGAPLVTIADGRDIWKVFEDEKFLGNSRVDVCSRILKRDLADRWIAENFTPDNVTCYVGIDWSEIHRFERLVERKLPWIYKAPLCDRPYMSKPQMRSWAKREGLPEQRLYRIGAAHANCGGGCVKAGVGHWRNLFQKWPERYLEWEERERELYKKVPNVKPFLRIQRDNKKIYLTLEELRKNYLEPELEDKACRVDALDYGGCGCFSDE